MEDIVDRLRQWAGRIFPTNREYRELVNEAADEIERLRAEVDLLRKDAERLDWIASVVDGHSSFWLLPCGEDLRFVQLRHFDDCRNYPVVEGVRAAIDAAMKDPK